MKKASSINILLIIIILSGLGSASCRKNFERLLAVKTSSVDTASFLVKGEVIDVGTDSPDYGFCYSRDPNPTLGNSQVVNLGATKTPATFQTNLPVSDSGYTYYVRAWAGSNQGTEYGDILRFYTNGKIEYYYDNGTSDYGWKMSEGYDGYMGNLFPVNTSGRIKSVKVYFNPYSGAGSEMVQVEFFDQERRSIGYTNPFTPVASSWVTISGLSLPYNGNFYAMVHWNYVVTPTNYLAMDQSGPNAFMDLAYIFFQGKWSKLSSDPAGNGKAGNFLIRVTVQPGSRETGSVITEQTLQP